MIIARSATGTLPSTRRHAFVIAGRLPYEGPFLSGAPAFRGV